LELALTFGESIVLAKVPSDMQYVVAAICIVLLAVDMIPHQGDGLHWTGFSGEVYISPDIKVGSFKACGLSIKVTVRF